MLAINADSEYKAETAAICTSALEERTLATHSATETLDDTDVQTTRAKNPIELPEIEASTTLFAEKPASETSKSGHEYLDALTSKREKVAAISVLDDCTSRDQAETITGQIDELKAAHAELADANTDTREALEQFKQEEVDRVLAERKAEEERFAAERAEAARAAAAAQAAAEAERQRQAKVKTPAPAPRSNSGGAKTGGGSNSGGGGGSTGGGGGNSPSPQQGNNDSGGPCSNPFGCKKHDASHLPPGFNPAV